MIRKVLVLLTTIVGASVYPAIALSQQSATDFPQEQVKEANKQLDLFIKSLETFEYPISIDDDERIKIINRYLGEADRSPYFWKYMRTQFNEGRYRVMAACETCYMAEHTYVAAVVRASLSNVLTVSWGTLILTSEPAGADVFLNIASSRTKEGQTIIRRRYPEGKYDFILEMNGYKSKEITISINKETPTQERIVLEKQ